MSTELNELDRLADRVVEDTAAALPSMQWIAERSAQLRQRRHILIATVAAPALVFVGIVGWMALGRDTGAQSIESIDQPEDGSAVTDDDGAAPDAQAEDQASDEVGVVTVPNVIGLNEEEASEILQEVGLAVRIDWVSEVAGGGTVSPAEVVGTEPVPGMDVMAGEVVVLFFYRPEQQLFSDYNDPGLRAMDLYPLVLDPANLGQGWGEFFLARVDGDIPLDDPGGPGSADALDDENSPDFADCAQMEPVIVRNGYIAEYGFGESPDDAIFVVTTGTRGELQSFYDNYPLLDICQGSNPLERVLTPLPDPDLPGVVEAKLWTANDNLNQRSDVLLIHHPDFVYLLDIGIKDGAAPFDIVALAADLLAAYDASR